MATPKPSAANEPRYVLRRTETHTHYVPDRETLLREFGAPVQDESWDDFIIRVFERFDGSIYGDEFFPTDANPQVGIEVEVYDPEA